MKVNHLEAGLLTLGLGVLLCTLCTVTLTVLFKSILIGFSLLFIGVAIAIIKINN